MRPRVTGISDSNDNYLRNGEKKIRKSGDTSLHPNLKNQFVQTRSELVFCNLVGCATVGLIKIVTEKARVIAV